jgi:hypothetical protein
MDHSKTHKYGETQRILLSDCLLTATHVRVTTTAATTTTESDPNYVRKK